MRNTPTVQKLGNLLRARVCADCPYRTAGTDGQGCETARACESKCPVFVHLPVLYEAARQVDPIVGHPKRVLRKILKELSHGRSAGARATRLHQDRVNSAIAELFGH